MTTLQKVYSILNQDNKCKQYAYSYETEQSIKQYCKDNNINKYRIINTTIVKTFAVDVETLAEEALNIGDIKDGKDK